MNKQNYIFAFIIVGLVVYNVMIRIRQYRRFKCRKKLREKYPNGFIRHGKTYTFHVNADPKLSYPYLRRSDDKIFKYSEIKQAGFIDCSFEFEGFFSDYGGGTAG